MGRYKCVTNQSKNQKTRKRKNIGHTTNANRENDVSNFLLNFVGADSIVKSKIVNNCARGLVTVLRWFKIMLLEADRSVAERGFQKRRVAQSRREMRRLSSCSVRRSISAIL